MNIYYAPPKQINNGFAELLDQEAKHASKVMRAREGDELTIVDGEGGRYTGPIRRITNKSVQVEIIDEEYIQPSEPQLILGMGIIKKRDRLEFAVEKAIELGAAKIALFRSKHSIKENVRMDRLQAIAISAMKQSLQSYLCEINLYYSLDEMLEKLRADNILVAHEKVDSNEEESILKSVQDAQKNLLLVGPEGGFSSSEIESMTTRGAKLVSLGKNRLRAETAAVAFMSQFL